MKKSSNDEIFSSHSMFSIEENMKLSTILGYHPSENQKKFPFFAWKFIQAALFIGYTIFIIINRDKILYMEDMWGKIADYYKTSISFTIGTVVIFEPMFNFQNHKDFQA